jgi:hypothetical protein
VVDACNFLLYWNKDKDVMGTTEELRDWGIEWTKCVNEFLEILKAAGFPHPVSMASCML